MAVLVLAVFNMPSLWIFLQNFLGCCISVTFWHQKWSISFIKCSITLHSRYTLSTQLVA